MISRHLYKPFEVSTVTIDQWEALPHIYYFFEIVHILEGSGIRYVNHNNYPYQAGDILIYTPQDCRSFEIGTPTTFCFVRFSDMLFDHCVSLRERSALQEWLRKMEYIIFNHNQQGQLLLKDKEDELLIKSFLNNTIQEYQQVGAHSQENLRHFMSILLNIIHRNISQEHIHTPAAPEQVNHIIHYIRAYVYEPARLTIPHLAVTFMLSPNYIGEYFKKHTGESIQSHILQYKLSLVKLKLAYSDLTIAAIAHELDFSDESHLHRLFRKATGHSPNAYRRMNKV